MLIYPENPSTSRSSMCSLPPRHCRVHVHQGGPSPPCPPIHPLTFQHLHCHGDGLLGFVFIDSHCFCHDYLPEATFPQGFAQRQPRCVNTGLAQRLWLRGTGREIPELNIKIFQRHAYGTNEALGHTRGIFLVTFFQNVNYCRSGY